MIVNLGIVKAVERAAQRQPVVVVEAPRGLSYQQVVAQLLSSGVYRHRLNLEDYAGVGARELVALLNSCEHGTVVENTHANTAVFVAVEHVMRLNRPGHFLFIGEFVQVAAVLQARVQPIVMSPPTMAEMYGGPTSYLASLLAADPDVTQVCAGFEPDAWPPSPFRPDISCVSAEQAALYRSIPPGGVDTSELCAQGGDTGHLLALRRAHLVHLVDGWREGSGWVVPLCAPTGSSRSALRCLVASELLAQVALDASRYSVASLAARGQSEEVDLIISTGSDPDAVWIQVSDAVDSRDLDSSKLSAVKRRWPSAFRRGVIFYAGAATVRLEDGIFAVPVTALWTASAASVTTNSGSLEDELNSVALLLRQQLPDLTRNSIERTQRLTRWLESNAPRPMGKVVSTMTNLGLPCAVSVVGVEGGHVDATFTVTVGQRELVGTVRAMVEGDMTLWQSSLGESDTDEVRDLAVKARLAWSDTFGGGYEHVLGSLFADLVSQLPRAISVMMAAA